MTGLPGILGGLTTLRRFYVVAYHNIIAIAESDYPFDLSSVSCDRSEFEKQLRYFQKNFHVIPYRELESALAAPPDGRPLLIITFDDGYASFHDIAWPLLAQYNLPATVFLPVTFIESGELFWWDEVMFLCHRLGCERFFKEALAVFFFPDSKLRFALNCGEAYFRKYLLHYLKQFSNHQIHRFQLYLRRRFANLLKLNKAERRRAAPMAVTEIKTLAHEGVDFASKSLHHLLQDQCGSAEIDAELALSRQRIEEWTGQPVLTFCYPRGRSDTAPVTGALQRHGYRHACLMEFGINSTATDSFRHRRIPLELGTWQGGVLRQLLFADMIRAGNRVRVMGKKLIATGNKAKIAGLLMSHRLAGHREERKPARHIFLAVCDHFEPYWGFASHLDAYRRVRRWLESLPIAVAGRRDADGRRPVYSFFYPEEEYKRNLLVMLAELCAQGYGEVEVHLHHDNDTDPDLRRKLTSFTRRLAEEHGLLARGPNGKIGYAFIHGNWSLDNSRPDGRWCGVNNELQILQESGCFADFTMPSAPDPCQTRTVNSIYYALDNPNTPKSHDYGRCATAGAGRPSGLLLVQGILGLRRQGIQVKLENSELSADNPATPDRIRFWLSHGVTITGRPDWRFIKLHTHGTQPATMNTLFTNGNLGELLSLMEEECDRLGACLHYVSAREMVNVIHAVEDGCRQWKDNLRDYELVRQTTYS